MKQHITPEMLNELTNGQKEMLRGWWVSRIENCDHYYHASTGKEGVICNPYHKTLALSHNNIPPILSIGQCIELLREKDYISVIFPTEKEWRMTRKSSYPKSNREYGREELIHALWEAIKVML